MSSGLSGFKSQRSHDRWSSSIASLAFHQVSGAERWTFHPVVLGSSPGAGTSIFLRRRIRFANCHAKCKFAHCTSRRTTGQPYAISAAVDKGDRRVGVAEWQWSVPPLSLFARAHTTGRVAHRSLSGGVPRYRGPSVLGCTRSARYPKPGAQLSRVQYISR